MKTNFLMINDLNGFTPKTRGILTAEEANFVRATLCTKEMDEIGLRNLRDFVVMLYGNEVDKLEREYKEGDTAIVDKVFAVMDKMSAVCGVIDNELFIRGCEV